MAAGDVTLTTPVSLSSLTLVEFHYSIPRAEITADYADATGRIFRVTLKDGVCVGFNFATGVSITVSNATALTDALGLVFKAGARTALTNHIRTIGAQVAPGTVG